MPTTSQLAQLYSLPEATVAKAKENLTNGTALFLTVSGRIGAGKDTVAPEVLKALGYTNAIHESFARPLREEVNEIIEIIKESNSLEEAVESTKIKLKATNVEVAVEALYEDVIKGNVKTSYERTASTRTALQWWGTEVRRQEDTDYWVKKALASSLKKIAEGQSIYVTDSRFPNEAASITSVGGILLRLEVSPEEQARRILRRDGIKPTTAALAHASELAMDNYVFPKTINTDELTLAEVIAEAVDYCEAKLKLKS